MDELHLLSPQVRGYLKTINLDLYALYPASSFSLAAVAAAEGKGGGEELTGQTLASCTDRYWY
jgi:hypothetical protein